jgi:hypothetical protein
MKLQPLQQPHQQQQQQPHQHQRQLLPAPSLHLVYPSTSSRYLLYPCLIYQDWTWVGQALEGALVEGRQL